MIFVRPAPVVMFAPLGVIPDGLPRIPVEVEVTQSETELLLELGSDTIH